jgi:hypothetical protein
MRAFLNLSSLLVWLDVLRHFHVDRLWFNYRKGVIVLLMCHGGGGCAGGAVK